MSTCLRFASLAIISLFALAVSGAITEAQNIRGGSPSVGGGFRGGGGPSLGSGGFRGGAIGGGGFRGGAIGGGSIHGFSGSGFRGAPAISGISRGGIARGYGPMIGSPGGRSFSGFRSAPQGFTSRGFTSRQYGIRSLGPSVGSIRGGRYYTGRALSDGGRFTARTRQLGAGALAASGAFARRDRNLVHGSMRGLGRASHIRNEAFASSPRFGRNQALRHASFRGGLADKSWRHHSHGGWYWRHRKPVIAIGWVGPLFWPYAYWDFVDYTFWPYAYDVFWPYVYDDLYVGVFGPYAYEGPAYASLPSSGRRARAARQRTTTAAVVCGAQAPALTDWPIQQITQTVQPDEAQQATLNDLKDATGKAVNALQSACPDDLPSTPTGRLAAMHKRTATMLLALSIVQPPLQRFYESLTDEQKARFNAVDSIAQAPRSARVQARPADLSQVCGEQALKPTSVPIERLAELLKPNDTQRSVLDALNDATTKAADHLKANCPTEQTLTPPGRVAAMEQRLNAMLEAIKIVQPALDRFYGSLTDEQKARFNVLGSSEG